MNLGLAAAHIRHLLEYIDVDCCILVIHCLRLTQKALFCIAPRFRHVPHDIESRFFKVYSEIRNTV